ncbi:AI-2E family transporter [Chondromyces crocatus]|uniref:AI-2E family transporter n=1 Tax=Chondromyces crocatus TaxID=52 RepID=A0A0K1E8M0_CHOCO|nr:AI-2E family transporter [Chondromyces crocatus]AKT36928.1 uncharacterized protein CMC5_010490 [Chondromyces crocatus]
MERADRWLSLVLRAVLIGLFLWTIKGLLSSVVVGAIFAVLLHPSHRRLQQRLGPYHALGPTLLTAGAVLVFILPQALIVSQLVSNVHDLLSRDWSGVLDRAQFFFAERMASLSGTFGVEVVGARGYLDEAFGRLGRGIAGMAGGVATSLPQLLVDLFLFIVSFYFFLRDGDALSRWVQRMSPFSPEETRLLAVSVRDTVNGAVLGLLATALVQGALTTLALSAFEVPGALLFGVIATLLSLLPLVGTAPVTLGAAFYLCLVGRNSAALGMLVAAAVIGISDNVVRPWVQSAQGGMHPLLALLSILGGLDLFGLSGLFVGPIVAAVALWAVDTYAALRLRVARPGRWAPPPFQ